MEYQKHKQNEMRKEDKNSDQNYFRSNLDLVGVKVQWNHYCITPTL